MSNLLRRAHDAGVKLVYGSDLLGGMQRPQNEEFRLLGQVQPAIDAIRSATVTAAALLERSGELGIVSEGATATHSSSIPTRASTSTCSPTSTSTWSPSFKAGTSSTQDKRARQPCDVRSGRDDHL